MREREIRTVGMGATDSKTTPNLPTDIGPYKLEYARMSCEIDDLKQETRFATLYKEKIHGRASRIVRTCYIYALFEAESHGRGARVYDRPSRYTCVLDTYQ